MNSGGNRGSGGGSCLKSGVGPERRAWGLHINCLPPTLRCSPPQNLANLNCRPHKGPGSEDGKRVLSVSGLRVLICTMGHVPSCCKKAALPFPQSVPFSSDCSIPTELSLFHSSLFCPFFSTSHFSLLYRPRLIIFHSFILSFFFIFFYFFIF